MTKEEILAMEAGDELDLAVSYGLGLPQAASLNGKLEVYNYSTDILAAWLIIEKLTEEWTKRNTPISIEVIYDCGAYETKIETWNENKLDWNKPIFSGSCDKAPEAICKAALIATATGK